MANPRSGKGRVGSTKAGPYAGGLLGGMLGYLYQHGKRSGGEGKGNVRKNLKGQAKARVRDPGSGGGSSSHAKKRPGIYSEQYGKGAKTPDGYGAKKPKQASASDMKNDTGVKPRRGKEKPTKQMKRARNKGKFDFGRAIRRGFGRI